MSMIVTGMDIPENCDYCNMNAIQRGAVSVCHYCILAKKEIKSEEEKLFDCPLKSVDGLIKRINERAYSETEYGIEEFDASKIVRLDDLIEIIKEYCGMEDAEC